MNLLPKPATTITTTDDLELELFRHERAEAEERLNRLKVDHRAAVQRGRYERRQSAERRQTMRRKGP